MAQETLQHAGAPVAETVTVDDFASLLQREFKPNTDAKQARIELAVKTLAQQALEETRQALFHGQGFGLGGGPAFAGRRVGPPLQFTGRRHNATRFRS